jgi:hypothetical protein
MDEARLRRLATRKGLRLMKSRSRTVEAAEYGTYMIVNRESNFVVASGFDSGYGLNLWQVEAYLTAN